MAIMADEDETISTHPPTESKQKRWSCYKTLKRLDIRELAIVDLGQNYTAEDPRIEENKAAFRRIRQRIGMLPVLEDLTVSVSGVDDELLQGFLGIENDDQGHQEHQTDEIEARMTTSTTTITINARREGAGSPHHRHPNQEVARSLVGPRLRKLRVQGRKEQGYSGADIVRFLRNFPGLKVYRSYQTHRSKYPEMAHGLKDAGIEIY
ncbi:hypothetical protein BG015_009018 [Linnemannia schmuckeri]|uniref:Uncharacterized protein n=1 Tax=Linnemannia schmuckeri TaxID=64567 RepID=A0A9P5RW45_9FUNG|nr:hypothetical protein BG015_009018 [Linnemannia schmuckeri]